LVTYCLTLEQFEKIPEKCPKCKKSKQRCELYFCVLDKTETSQSCIKRDLEYDLEKIYCNECKDFNEDYRILNNIP
jgi:hypothetical protein